MQIKISPPILEQLKQNDIFFTYHGENRFKEGDMITFSDDAWIERYCQLFAGSSIPTMGSFSYSWSPIPEGVTIGRYCSISWNLRVMQMNHPTDFVSSSSFTNDPNLLIFSKCLADSGSPTFNRFVSSSLPPERYKMPTIGHDVWIGQDVLLGRGITLGQGCVVGAGSVVTKSVPPYAIVGGNPAKLIRMRFDDDIVQGLLDSDWWKYKFPDFGQMSYNDIPVFLRQLADRTATGEIVPFRPDRLYLRQLGERSTDSMLGDQVVNG